MAADRDDFLRRWSRRKRAADAPAPAPKPAPVEPAPQLPSIDSLTFESDFKSFMHAKVEESVKRAALKKLFSDPRFNVIDFMDVYIDDYTKDDPIPPAMLAALKHSRTTLFGREEEKKGEEAQEKSKPQDLAQAATPAEGQQEEAKKEDDGAAG
jgi:Protein of unknown function (DUF3306)